MNEIDILLFTIPIQYYLNEKEWFVPTKMMLVVQ